MVIVSLEIHGARIFRNSYRSLSLQNSLNSKLLSSCVLWKSSSKRCTSFRQKDNLGSDHRSVKTVPSSYNERSQEKYTYKNSSPTWVNKDLWFDVAALDSLSRRELQKLCTKFGIRAISKTVKLIEDLKCFHKQNLSHPSSILHSPFIPGSISSRNQYKRSETHYNKDIDKASTIFASLDVPSSSVRRDEELQRLCRGVGARTTSSRSTARSLDSLKSNIGEFDKSFRVLADTCDEKEIVLRQKPSVSTILNTAGNKNKAFIISKWRKKKIAEMGEESFKKYQADITQKGRIFHSYIKDFLSGKNSSIDGVHGCAESVSSVLNDITCTIATEKRVSHYHLGYSGFLDTLALYKGIPCLIEWKTSEKPKKSLEDCHDFPLQVVAYAGALNSSPYFSVPVTTGLVVVAYRDGTPAHVHHMDMTTCDYYWQQWLVRVYRYKQNLYKDSQ